MSDITHKIEVLICVTTVNTHFLFVLVFGMVTTITDPLLSTSDIDILTSRSRQAP
jgi:hypothetical protein